MGLEMVMRRLVETGCTSFLPTIITQREDLYPSVSHYLTWTDFELLRLLRPRSQQGCAHILGCHAEGPFLHPGKRGAHAEELLMVAAGDEPMEALEHVYSKDALDQDGIKLITLAPDVEGVMGCIPALTKRGVIVSIGHR